MAVRVRSASLVVLVVLVAGLAACGGGDTVLPARSMTVIGTEMAFQSPDNVPEGQYQVTFRNVGKVYHELAFKDSHGKFLMRRSIAGGQAIVMSVKLSAGTYELGCFEPGHYEAGMHKMLTVVKSG